MTADTILKNGGAQELANAVEENVVAMFRGMARVLKGEIEETPQLGRYHAAPASPIFKGVFHANLSADEADSTIDETVEWFRRRNAPFFFWWTGQDTQPADLGSDWLLMDFRPLRKTPRLWQRISTS